MQILPLQILAEGQGSDWSNLDILTFPMQDWVQVGTDHIAISFDCSYTAGLGVAVWNYLAVEYSSKRDSVDGWLAHQ